MKRFLIAAFAARTILSGLCAAQSGEWPELANTTGGVLIQRLSKSAQWLSDFLVISKGGTMAIMDAWQTPDEVIAKIRPDLITVSHVQHGEHYDPALIAKFKEDPSVSVSLQKAETFIKKDITVRAAPSAHQLGRAILPQSPANVIYSLEVDGLRIVHFGGIGQKELEPGQIEALGRIDVSMVPFGLYKNEIISLMKQLKPKLIIVTHRMANVALDEVVKSLGTELEVIRNKLVLDPESVLNGTLRFVDLTNELY